VAVPSCNRFASHTESSSHALFGCKAAKKIWYAPCFGSLLSKSWNLPVTDVIQSITSQICKDDLGLVCMVTWAIWEDRNSLLNRGIAKEPKLVIS
jgi:hypothetical protein